MGYKTNEQFLIQLKNIHGNDYEPLEEYTYAKVPILVRHVLCGTEYKTTPDNILSGAGCKLCGYKKTGNSRRKTPQQFKEEVFELVSNEYIVLGDYKGANTKILIKHNIDGCGHEWDVSPSNFLVGTRCPICSKKNKKIYNKKSQEQVEREISEISNNEFIVLSKYKDNKTKLELKHNVEGCGHVFKKSLTNFKKYSNCPMCQGRMRNRTTDDFKLEVKNLVGDEYTVLGEFIDTKTYIRIKHNICNHEYEVEPTAFLGGNRCPSCNRSRGELAIQSYLSSNNINFESEYKIDDCKNIRPLPFDFAVFDEDENLIALIEFDGAQHFEAVNHFGGEEKFKSTQHNDNIKRQYCLDNNIKLLEIPHWEFDSIENILLELIA